MLQKTIYGPNSIPNGLFPFVKVIFRDFINGHYLGKQLFTRDIKAQYRQSFLGIFWAFAPAFVTALLWIFLNGAKVINVEVKGMTFTMFTLTGTLLWQLLTQSLNNTLNCVNNGKSLLTKLNFPRESLLIHAFYTTTFNAFILFIVTCMVVLVLGWRPSISFIYFPLLMIDLILIGTALGVLFVSVFSLISDFSRMLTIGLQLLMYVSSVIFPMPPEGSLAQIIFNLNPFTHVIIFGRCVFMGLPLDNVLGFSIVSITSVFVLILGLISYKITMPIIIERLGS